MRRISLRASVLVAVLLLPVAQSGQAQSNAANATPSSLAAVRHVQITSGQSTLIEHKERITRISVSSGDVAEALVLSPHEVQLNAKKPGRTSVTLWTAGGKRESWLVESILDVHSARRVVALLYPNSGVEVQSAGSAILLSGTLSDSSQAAALKSAVEALGAPVVSHLAIFPPRQIRLQVRLAEVSRSALRESGSNLLRLMGGTASLDRTGLRSLLENGDVDVTLSDMLDIVLMSPDLSIGAVIKALRSDGVFHSLAEPNLTTLAGQEATFLAGGEFPFPVSQGRDGGMTVQWKEFGVRLRFKPVILGNGAIRLEVEPEVSSLDFANGVEADGVQLPSLVTRRAHTVVDLQPGQTFAIAGLLDHELTRNANKFPVLGSIPVLGTFFRSSSARERRTELLVLVTPVLANPEESGAPVPGGEPSEWPWSAGMKPRASTP